MILILRSSKVVYQKSLLLHQDLNKSGNMSKERVSNSQENLRALKCERSLLVGLQEIFDQVWSCRRKEQGRIICLYGKSGVGKTTLWTQIYKQLSKTPLGFDIAIKVALPKDRKPAKIQDYIWRKLGLSSQKWKNKSFDRKAADIFGVLSKKKFVLLFDNLQDPLSLAEVGIPLREIKNGSKIIFTTADPRVTVGAVIEVEPLKWENAWELFRKNVGEEVLSIDPFFLVLAQDIAKQCGGFPLLLVVTARAMACRKTFEEWRIAYRIFHESNSKDFSGEVHKLLYCLKLSYYSLPDDRARYCFLLCALFPIGFRILKDDLVNFWICEEPFKNLQNQSEAHILGYHIIDILVQACLLEDEDNYVKIHDAVHAMVIRIINDIRSPFRFCLVEAGDQLTEAPGIMRWKGVRRISLMENSIRNLTEAPNCPQLLTLFLSHNRTLVEINDGFFQFMDALTVLDLSHTSIQELPKGVSKLASLQHLNLSHTWIEQLPLELKMLLKLKYLNLEHNDLLRMIPRQVISSLSGLQVFRMFGCGISLVEDEDNMLSYSNRSSQELHNLENLRMLSITITSAAALKNFCGSNKLPSCTRALSFKCFWGTKKINLSLLTKMQNLDVLELDHNDHLEELKFEFMTQESSSHCSLAILRQRSFNSLGEVTVRSCFHLQELTWIILAPNLTVLSVSDCREMEELISIAKLRELLNAVSENDLNPFSKLEVLELEELPQLKSIYWKCLPLPCLQKMKVFDCPKLKKLPLSSNSTNRLGLIIAGHEDWWKKVEWEDDAT